MGMTLAITGKGGTGKTTLAALFVSRLIALQRSPVLAVDADPNTSLDQALGVTVRVSVGTVREETRHFEQSGRSAGVTKQDWLGLKIAESLVEADRFDLISLGRPEGPGCYCYANNVLREVIRKLVHQYPAVVIDNEAGLENLSRRLVQRADVLVMTADPSLRGLATMRRLFALAHEMQIDFRKPVLLINRARTDEIRTKAVKLGAELGIPDVVVLPEDPLVAEFGERGMNLRDLPTGNPVVTILDRFLIGLLEGNPDER